MKIKFSFTFLIIGLFCFGQNTNDSIAIEKKKQHSERILAEMIKRKDEAVTKLGKQIKIAPIDSIQVNDKAIFDEVFKNVNDSFKIK